MRNAKTRTARVAFGNGDLHQASAVGRHAGEMAAMMRGAVIVSRLAGVTRRSGARGSWHNIGVDGSCLGGLAKQPGQLPCGSAWAEH